MDWSFYAVAIPAVIILGVGKGGFAGIGMVALPLMALAMPPLKAASIMLPILVVQDLVGAWAYRRTWDRRNLAILVPGAAAGVLCGYLLAAKLPTGVVEATLGLISILFGGQQMALALGSRRQRARRATTLLGLACGAGSGFTSMIAHAGAPPFQLYTIPQRLPRDVFVGTSVIFFTVVNWMKTGPYILLGEINRENLLLSLGLMPLAIASAWLGVFLVRRTGGRVFYMIIFGLMILVGVRLLVRGLSSL
ncbi:sulfite exporter TauE/SafE family protein [Faunimonas sp. B44]|uniref:sulfite exporter TauE/SafE family protein n=1 Tax=Faunimonas sp. B44 TaxID=3461493 RepID=UPI004044601F